MTSSEKHTLELWIAVHRRAAWVYDPEKSAARKLLDEGVDFRTVFPSDFFPDDSGQAVYRDVASLNFRGYVPNAVVAELTWDQVLGKKLSESLELRNQLVEHVRGTSKEIAALMKR